MLKQRQDYFESEQGKNIKQVLELMSDDSKYSTVPTYTTNSALYPNNLIPFVDRHMDYLNCHPKLEAWGYIANVKMATRLY